MGNSTPCKGDAFKPMVKIAVLAFTNLTREYTDASWGCSGCERAESNGGKCAGEEPFTFMLDCVADYVGGAVT